MSVVVSASRIDRAGYSAPTPTVSIGAATLEQRATVNIGDILNEIPSFRGSQTPAGGGIANSFPLFKDSMWDTLREKYPYRKNLEDLSILAMPEEEIALVGAASL